MTITPEQCSVLGSLPTSIYSFYLLNNLRRVLYVLLINASMLEFDNQGNFDAFNVSFLGGITYLSFNGMCKFAYSYLLLLLFIFIFCLSIHLW